MTIIGSKTSDIEKVFSARRFTSGMDNTVSTHARTRLNNATKTDSVRYWNNNLRLLAPVTFRTPTSLNLSVARAVDRFTKFISAIKRITNATIEKILMYLLSLIGPISYSDL